MKKGSATTKGWLDWKQSLLCSKICAYETSSLLLWHSHLMFTLVPQILVQKRDCSQSRERLELAMKGTGSIGVRETHCLLIHLNPPPPHLFGDTASDFCTSMRLSTAATFKKLYHLYSNPGVKAFVWEGRTWKPTLFGTAASSRSWRAISGIYLFIWDVHGVCSNFCQKRKYVGLYLFF